MIYSKRLSLHYWVEAINCSNYIVNQTLTNALKDITLEEEWNKIKPYLSQFHVFGSVTSSHIPDDKMKSLEAIISQIVFYEVITTKKKFKWDTIFSRDLIFLKYVKGFE
jgi:hypothetical protein